VEEAKTLRGELVCGHTKNLFLRNKKGRMWLVVCLEDRDIDLKDLAGRLDAGRLSFASAGRLMTYLGVVPGAVTPFSLMNDRTGAVTAVLDEGMLARHDRLNFHPLDNAMTTAIAPDDLVRFLKAIDHAPVYLRFDPGDDGG
jgi:Ala-tRNA(Pro) deacylase